MTRRRVHPWIIGVTAVYGWEIAALSSRRLPSISATCWSLRHTARGRALLALAIGGVLWHLLGTGPGAMPAGWSDERSSGRWFGVPLRGELGD